VPSQCPEGIEAVALSSQSLMVTWSPPPLYTLHGILQGYKIIYKLVKDDEGENQVPIDAPFRGIQSSLLCARSSR